MSGTVRKRKFARRKLKGKLRKKTFEKFVSLTEEFLDRRFKFLAEDFDDITKTNFNPFLLLITSPAYNMFSPFEVAERLQLGKAYHGDDTAFGRMGEEKYLFALGAKPPPEKKSRGDAWEPVDLDLTVDGKRYLLSIKSGPWTMNQGHANAMIDKFPNIHGETGARLVIGIMYGTYESLNNKPQLVENRLDNPKWFDYMVGKDFWEFASGVKDVHKELFRAIRQAQRNFGERHRDETFHEKLVSNRLKIAASLRKQFDVDEEEDFWETLFNNAFSKN